MRPEIDRDDSPGYTTTRDRALESRRDWRPAHRWDDLFNHLPFGFWAPPGSLFDRTRRGRTTAWFPEVESFQRGDEFIVRVDLPGLQKKDISVEVQDDALVIQGERSNERQHDEKGYYSSERNYGQFCRVIPLPDGAIADNVNATFRDGVLEVVVKAPPHEVSRGRKIDIQEGPR